MRRLVPLLTFFGLMLLSAAIMLTGRHLAAIDAASPVVEDIDIETMDQIDEGAAAATQSVGIGEAAPYQRLQPRPPLSEPAMPQPPKPERPPPARLTPLFQPVASAAGSFEAMGYRITVAGTEMVGPDETCSFGGRNWPCGARARAAFRAFLRGRAVTCPVPPVPDENVISADCRVGHDNVGEWLVENGWARATPGGPYVALGESAKSADRGIFGPPPR